MVMVFEYSLQQWTFLMQILKGCISIPNKERRYFIERIEIMTNVAGKSVLDSNGSENDNAPFEKLLTTCKIVVRLQPGGF